MQAGEFERGLLPDSTDAERTEVRVRPAYGAFQQRGLSHAGLGEKGKRTAPPGTGPHEQFFQHGDLVVATT
jgi:hypothetical protein